MSRLLKPQKVDHIVVGAGRVAVDIMLDRNRLDFFATLGLDEVRAPTAKECKEKARELASAWRPTTWEGRIRVRVTHGSSGYYIHDHRADNIEVQLVFYRFERAQKLDGDWVERVHTIDYENDQNARPGWRDILTERRDRGEGWRTHDIEPDDGERDFAYTDQLWQGLVTVQAMITRAGEQLSTLLAQPDFDKRLAAVQDGLDKLLPAPATKKKGNRRHGT